MHKSIQQVAVLSLLSLMGAISNGCGFSEAYQKALTEQRARSAQGAHHPLPQQPASSSTTNTSNPASVWNNRPILGTNWKTITTSFPLTFDLEHLTFMIHPNTTSTFYVGTDRGLYKSTNGGTNWESINDGLEREKGRSIGGINTLAIDPQVPSTLYVGADGVSKSVDEGKSWKNTNAGMGRNPVAFAIAIDPQDSRIVYAGTGTGIYKTTDGGMHWSLRSTGLPYHEPPYSHLNIGVLVLALNPQAPSMLYAGTHYGVFKSTDGGDHWSEINKGLEQTHYRLKGIKTLAIDPQVPSTVYAGTFRGVYKSTNSGGTWIESNNGLWNPVYETMSPGATDVGIVAIAIDNQVPSTVYAVTETKLFKSLNGGADWMLVDAELLQGIHGRNRILTLTIDPQHPKTIFVGTKYGIVKTTSGGEK